MINPATKFYITKHDAEVKQTAKQVGDNADIAKYGCNQCRQ
jgi:hypothetical protein